MRRLCRALVVAIAAVHGTVQLVAVADGLGWVDTPLLDEPVTGFAAALWLAAARLTLWSAVLLAGSVRWWWIVGAGAAL